MSAAQLMATNGPLRRALRSWMQRATSSLPAPLWPVTSTVVSGAWATWSMRVCTSRIAGDKPTSSVAVSSRTRSCSHASSLRSCRISRQRRTTARMRSPANGFSMTSAAPLRIASTVLATVP